MHLTTIDPPRYRDDDGTLVAVLPAEIDLVNAAALRSELCARLADGPPALVLDLSGTRFCDSTGAEALARVHARAARAGIAVHLVLPAGGPARTVCGLLGLTSAMPCFEDLAAARAALS
ncbi:hypothetical protein GCM10009678_46860 [Actinomadura kijaniata]|uniref:Anti-anti-sigma factor n=1 Tax=Actinomadura namibiensis TaxID=182080 RepID=A0A7W3LKX5_ACTNM|nr:STAS domain-containing protein [Actinomadura namibiensis]MBA8950004.1 anti-anti-sigma factor [Actinomadura namibiensis]